MSDIFGGMFDEFSVAYVEMLEAKSGLWKRAAKKWRYNYKSLNEDDLEIMVMLEEKADRRLELLRRAKQYLKHDKDCTNHTFPDDNWCDCLLRVIIEDIDKELADA